jgi:hypothetical protein
MDRIGSFLFTQNEVGKERGAADGRSQKKSETKLDIPNSFSKIKRTASNSYFFEKNHTSKQKKRRASPIRKKSCSLPFIAHISRRITCNTNEPLISAVC